MPRRAGHEVRVVDYLRCVIDITSHRPALWYSGNKLEDFDAVIPRIGASHTFYGTAVVRQFEMMGTYSVVESQGLSRSRDKLRSMQLLAAEGVGLPVTSFAHSYKDVDGLIDLAGGAPLIVKLLEGTQGMGVVLAETRKAAESVIGAFRQLDANVIVQEFIKEAGGSDIRAFVVGNRVVAAMERKAAAGEFRSNVHRGGQATPRQADPRGARHRQARGQDHRPQRRRRRPDALQPRSGGPGGQLLPRPRGHRDLHRRRRRRQDRRVHRGQRQARPPAHPRLQEGLTPRACAGRQPSPPTQTLDPEEANEGPGPLHLLDPAELLDPEEGSVG